MGFSIYHLFAQSKSKARHSASTNEDQLVHNIHVAIEKISQENCRQYYDKMDSNIFKILAGQFLDDTFFLGFLVFLKQCIAHFSHYIN